MGRSVRAAADERYGWTVVAVFDPAELDLCQVPLYPRSVGERSAIEWTEATWNPVAGCSKVSPGCAHCYAEALSLRFGRSQLPWTVANASENVVLHPERLEQPLRWRRPRMVFVNSMSAWGAETRSSCRGRKFVFVDEAAEEIEPPHLKIVRRRAGSDAWDASVRVGRLQVEGSVGLLSVVVTDVDAEHMLELAAAEDQQPVKTFATDAADAAHVSVAVGRPHGSTDRLDVLGRQETIESAREFASRPWMRKRTRRLPHRAP